MDEGNIYLLRLLRYFFNNNLILKIMIYNKLNIKISEVRAYFFRLRLLRLTSILKFYNKGLFLTSRFFDCIKILINQLTTAKSAK